MKYWCAGIPLWPHQQIADLIFLFFIWVIKGPWSVRKATVFHIAMIFLLNTVGGHALPMFFRGKLVILVGNQLENLIWHSKGKHSYESTQKIHTRDNISRYVSEKHIQRHSFPTNCSEKSKTEIDMITNLSFLLMSAHYWLRLFIWGFNLLVRISTTCCYLEASKRI